MKTGNNCNTTAQLCNVAGKPRAVETSACTHTQAQHSSTHATQAMYNGVVGYHRHQTAKKKKKITKKTNTKKDTR